ncbi:tripartite motif-containing protein 14-like, partial [Mantella aurantiaca]
VRDVTLDPETSHHNVYVTRGNRRALCKLQPQSCCDSASRFDHYTQVLGSDPLGSGRHYWEVGVSGNRVSIGVSYASISRKGYQSHCLAGRNPHSWCLEWSSSRCYAWHDSQRVLVATGLQEKIGVFVDWEDGNLSFYEVSEDMTLLHQFHVSFIKPVYPIFYISWNSIMSIGETVPTAHSAHRFHRQMSAQF